MSSCKCHNHSTGIRKPKWLRRRLPSGPTYEKVRGLIHNGRLHTVCQEAKCPNQWECFSNKTATFLIMGSRCTRNCRFCAVGHGPDKEPDPKEPLQVAEAARDLGLKYVVVTSVTRDDLADGGASFFAETIRAIRGEIPDAMIEVLIPDFQGDINALKTVLEARPNVLNHNVETVKRLYPDVRPQAIFERSVSLLRTSREIAPDIPTKSGLMLGLGETDDEISETLDVILKAGCHMLTLGQYLQPSSRHLPVKKFIPPEEFDHWKSFAISAGFPEVASGPFVRSSYHAMELFLKAEKKA